MLGVGSLCAVPLCVSNSGVFNEISHFLLFFLSWFHFLPELRGVKFIHTHFSFFPFLFTLLCTNCYSAFSVQPGTFLSKWLSFSFKLAWADLPCNKISTCWTEWHAIQHDCNSLKSSRMCCHCHAGCTAHYVSSEKFRHTASHADSVVVLRTTIFTYSQIFWILFALVSASTYALALVVRRDRTVCVWVFLCCCACVTVCLYEWLTDKRPPEDGGMTIAHPSSVIQHSTGAINF